MSALEFELLLASARTAPDTTRIQELVRQNPDWNLLWQFATHFGVRPLVCRSMQMTCWSEVPEQSQREWQDSIQVLTGRNLFLAGELIAIVDAIETAGIQVCVLKGLLYGQILYGDLTLRETNDFDLLINEDDFQRTALVLRNLGYAPRSEADLEQVPELLKYVGEYPFVGVEKLEIDLHWGFSNKPLALAPDWSDFPLGPQKFTLGGSAVHSIAIEELPLYLATQGGNDSWNDLRRVADLAEYLRRYPDTDWSPIVAAARRHRSERVLLAGLQLAVNLFGAALPRGVTREDLQIREMEKLAAKVANRMREQKVAGTLQSHVFQIQAKDGAGEKAQLFWSILTDRMMADTNWVRLPRSLWWLYRGLRPIRMVLKLGGAK